VRFGDTTVRRDEDEDDELPWDDLLPSLDAGPEELLERRDLVDELAFAIEQLPEAQRRVFVAHAVEGRSFKEIAAETGANVNTLLSRKRTAVRSLRELLQDFYDDFTNG